MRQIVVIMCEVNGNEKMDSECDNKSYFSEVSGPSSYYELSPNQNNSVSSTRTISNSNSWVNNDDQQQTDHQDMKHNNNNTTENKNSVNESLNSRSNKSYGQPTNFQMPTSQWNFSSSLGNSYQRLYNDYHNYILSPNASQQCALVHPVAAVPTALNSESLHIHQMQTSHHLKKFYYQGAQSYIFFNNENGLK